MESEKEELDKWHRFFAVENNNRAWDLASQSSRTLDESTEMLNAAHASALHWSKVGSKLNIVRANMLLAEVHALLGMGESSLALSEEVSNFFQNQEADAWERAFVETIHAHAAAVAGKHDVHAERYRAAEVAIASISDEEDRKVVLKTFDQVPAPSFDT